MPRKRKTQEDSLRTADTFPTEVINRAVEALSKAADPTWTEIATKGQPASEQAYPVDALFDQANGTAVSAGMPEMPSPLDEAIEAAHATTEMTGQGDCGVIEATSSAGDDARACAEKPPQSVEERLAGLPQWQVRYVLALMECHGVIALACVRCKVSRESVEEHQTASPAFAAACRAAVEHSSDLLEAAGMRGATIGDLQPVYQGRELVGYKRVRSPKDLEIMLKVRGRLKDESAVNVQHSGRVEVVQDCDLPRILLGIAEALFGGQPTKVVSIQDKEG